MSDHLAAGLSDTEIRDRLARWPVHPQEVVEWFQWHNGAVPGRPGWQLAPANWDFFSLDDVEREHQLAVEGSAEIQSWGETGFGWRESWIPWIGIREAVVAVDCWTGEVLRGNLAAPRSFGTVIAPSIEHLVRQWLALLNEDYGEFRWHISGGFTSNSIYVSEKWRSILQ